MYYKEDIIRIAKRENNTKRNYLLINRLQAKHIAVDASDTLNMFDELAEKLKKRYVNENVLIIGFAETATAIASHMAIALDSLYIQTSREFREDEEYIYFEESHSHAVDQKLYSEGLKEAIVAVDRIIFVEDEITSGSTILNLINALESMKMPLRNYSVASIINGMQPEHTELYDKKSIDIDYLVKSDNSAYIGIAEGYSSDGEYINADSDRSADCQKLALSLNCNPRKLIRASELNKACDAFTDYITKQISFEKTDRVLVLGTEEFMYPAIKLAARLAKELKYVRTHSTTRSPIEVSKAEDYPLKSRYELKSLYDESRNTYIYDLETYDKVLILSDADIREGGLKTLISALKIKCNHNIYMVQWQ